MQLVEKTIIRKYHPYYKEIDNLSFKSKNLYNAALYAVRQEFIKNNSYLSAYDLFKLFKNSNQPDYISLPRKVSMQTLFQVDNNFKAFFNANKSYKQNPSKFNSKPKIPKYKDKIKGRNIVIYDKQAVSVKYLKKGLIHLSDTNIFLSTKKVTLDTIAQVQISKQTGHYVIYTIYNAPDTVYQDNGNTAAIDLGLNNLAVVTYSNNKQPIIVNGKPLKSINQYYNKKKAEYQSKLDNNKKTSSRIQQLSAKRNNKISDYTHKASRYLVNQLVSNNITNLIIGYNPEWKQEINIGRKNNQNFTAVPFATFIDKLSYKAKLAGISVKIQEESYTSKCSFIDLETIEKHEKYIGKRVKRGMFKSANNRKINADINGSYNIMRKAAPSIFLDKLKVEGVEGVAVRPILVTI